MNCGPPAGSGSERDRRRCPAMVGEAAVDHRGLHQLWVRLHALADACGSLSHAAMRLACVPPNGPRRFDIEVFTFSPAGGSGGFDLSALVPSTIVGRSPLTFMLGS